MRLAISILGTEVLAVEFGPAEVEDDDDPGSFTSYPVGFTRPDVPWDVEAPVHSFDPDGADEDA